MRRVTRRVFLTTAAAAAGGVMVHANPLNLPIGSQTWPHRQMIKDGNFAGLLETLKSIGVGTVELCSPFGYPEFASLTDGKAVKRMIADHGLTCDSSHFGLRELREGQQRSIDWAHDVGIKEMYVATLSGPSAPTMDDVKRAADEYNRIAAVAAKAGMQQGLHNEDFEMTTVGGPAPSGVEGLAPSAVAGPAPSGVEGRRTYDVLLELLDPQLVKYQFQMSTISRGFVAAEYFTKYPGRFISMHIQDVAPAAAGAERPTQVAVGQGMIDWPATFAAARTGGVKSYYVEQTMDLTRASVAALQKM